jgi:SAM-dependent methyltransferase
MPSITVVQSSFAILGSLFHQKRNLLKARVTPYQHVRLFPPESLVVNQSVLGSGEPTLLCNQVESVSNKGVDLHATHSGILAARSCRCSASCGEEADRVFDLYNNAYGNYASDPYRQVRIETYGRDFGQTSWVTTDESLAIPRLLNLGPDSSLLEVGCGSGGYALHLAEKLGCQIVGLDINEPGIRSAKELAQTRALGSRARFEQCDVSKKLPFDDETFDAAFSNDVLCHVSGRFDLLVEMFRVLKPSGRMLFSDALVIGGMISAEEIAIRSSIGFYFYSPPGENERLLKQAGFSEVGTTNTTENAARISKKWHDAREKRREELVTAEGSSNFEGLQRFLSCVHTLTSERRLLRYLYFSRKGS